MVSQMKPTRRKGIVPKSEYLTKEDLDLRPYAQRKHLIKDHKLESFLKACRRRFRRGAVCVYIDGGDTDELLRYSQDLATMAALNNCF